jgi:metal-responsive CopG/Arc/MetJ family transcriptional regulator
MGLQRVTCSLPRRIVVATDAIVRQDDRSRSSILREAIEQYLKAREEMEMIAEYAEAAELNRALAEEHMEAFSEVVGPGL